MTGPPSATANEGGVTSSRARHSKPGSAEAPITLPSGKLIGLVVGAVVGVGGMWFAIIALGPWGTPELASGLAGIAVAAVMGVLGVVIMTPWRARPMADWMNLWLLATVFRMLGTPAAAYLLYSAASPTLAAKPFGLAVALTYIATLFVEAAALAKHLKAAIDQPLPIDSGHAS